MALYEEHVEIMNEQMMVIPSLQIQISLPLSITLIIQEQNTKSSNNSYGLQYLLPCVCNADVKALDAVE